MGGEQQRPLCGCAGWVYVLYCHKKKSKRGIGIPKHEDNLTLDRYREALDD